MSIPTMRSHDPVRAEPCTDETWLDFVPALHDYPWPHVQPVAPAAEPEGHRGRLQIVVQGLGGRLRSLPRIPGRRTGPLVGLIVRPQDPLVGVATHSPRPPRG